MSTNKSIRDAKMALQSLNCTVVSVEYVKSHIKFVVCYKEQTRFFFLPCSGSDRRGMLNWIGDVKRWIRSV